MLDRPGPAFRPRPVRQGARAVREGRPDLRARGRGGCRCSMAWTCCLQWFVRDVRPRFPDSPVLFADESGGRLHRGTIRNRLRYLLRAGRRCARRPVQPARAAAGLRHPQLRARRGPGGDPADARSLDGRLHDAVCPAVRDLHRRCLPAGGLGHPGQLAGGGRGCGLGGGCGWLPLSGRCGPAPSCGGCWPSGPGWNCPRRRCRRCSAGNQRR